MPVGTCEELSVDSVIQRFVQPERIREKKYTMNSCAFMILPGLKTKNKIAVSITDRVVQPEGFFV